MVSEQTKVAAIEHKDFRNALSMSEVNQCRVSEVDLLIVEFA